MRIVLDTNVVISRYLSPTGTPAKLFTHWERQSFDVLVSEPILAEYAEALLYPHIQALHKKTKQDVKLIIDRFRKIGKMVIPSEEVTIVKNDPDDNKFLACALSGHAEFLVSGDRDLLTVKEYRGVYILTPQAFLALLEQKEAA